MKLKGVLSRSMNSNIANRIALVSQGKKTAAGRVALEGRTRRFAAQLSGRPFERAVIREFERLWLGLHSKSDDHDQAQRLAVNSWLVAQPWGHTSPFLPRVPGPDVRQGRSVAEIGPSS